MISKCYNIISYPKYNIKSYFGPVWVKVATTSVNSYLAQWMMTCLARSYLRCIIDTSYEPVFDYTTDPKNTLKMVSFFKMDQGMCMILHL